jgi:hypothetical protein
MGFTFSPKDQYDRTGLSSLRLILYKDEVCRLPRDCQELRVVSGRAWVTIPEKDMFLSPGDRVALNPRKAFALASALGNAPLVMEVWGRQEIGVL